MPDAAVAATTAICRAIALACLGMFAYCVVVAPGIAAVIFVVANVVVGTAIVVSVRCILARLNALAAAYASKIDSTRRAAGVAHSEAWRQCNSEFDDAELALSAVFSTALSTVQEQEIEPASEQQPETKRDAHQGEQDVGVESAVLETVAAPSRPASSPAVPHTSAVAHESKIPMPPTRAELRSHRERRAASSLPTKIPSLRVPRRASGSTGLDATTVHEAVRVAPTAPTASMTSTTSTAVPVALEEQHRTRTATLAARALKSTLADTRLKQPSRYSTSSPHRRVVSWTTTAVSPPTTSQSVTQPFDHSAKSPEKKRARTTPRARGRSRARPSAQHTQVEPNDARHSR